MSGCGLLRASRKVLGCRVPGTRGAAGPPLSLAISLQLVGELEEEVLVVDDLELAHVGLGLQVMRGGLHVQAWGVERERCQLSASLYPLHASQAGQGEGCEWEQALAGSPWKMKN